jgi:hypothetical protein
LESDGADIEIDIAGPIDAAVAALTAAGLRVAFVNASVVRVAFETDETYDQIARALSSVSVPVRRLQRTRRTLEDAFLEAIAP